MTSTFRTSRGVTRCSHRTRRLAILGILAIAGTLLACGRYGRPVRPAPAPDARAADLRSDIRAAAVLPIPTGAPRR